MARFDVFVSAEGVLVLDVRADQLERMGNLVLVPLFHVELAPKPLRDLNPIFEVDGARYVMMTQLIASAPPAEFEGPVWSLSLYRDEIVRALDTLLIGF